MTQRPVNQERYAQAVREQGRAGQTMALVTHGQWLYVRCLDCDVEVDGGPDPMVTVEAFMRDHACASSSVGVMGMRRTAYRTRTLERLDLYLAYRAALMRYRNAGGEVVYQQNRFGIDRSVEDAAIREWDARRKAMEAARDAFLEATP